MTRGRNFLSSGEFLSIADSSAILVRLAAHGVSPGNAAKLNAIEFLDTAAELTVNVIELRWYCKQRCAPSDPTLLAIAPSCMKRLPTFG